MLRNHIFDHLVYRISLRISTKFTASSHFPLLFQKKLKRNCFILLPSWHRRKSSFISDLKPKQRGLHLYHSTLGASFLTLSSKPLGGLPYFSYTAKGVHTEFSIRKLAFSSITFLGSTGTFRPPGGLPFCLKNSEFGQKRGRCHYLNSHPWRPPFFKDHREGFCDSFHKFFPLLKDLTHLNPYS